MGKGFWRTRRVEYAHGVRVLPARPLDFFFFVFIPFPYTSVLCVLAAIKRHFAFHWRAVGYGTDRDRV